MSLQAWKRHACLVAGRTLTADEWQEALPGRPYQARLLARLRASARADYRR